MTIIQGPIEVEIGCNEVSKALIEIPTMSMSDDPNRIQVGNPRPDTFQPIEIYAIKDSNDRLIMVYLYQGDDEELNTQAEEIINSILISCSAE